MRCRSKNCVMQSDTPEGFCWRCAEEVAWLETLTDPVDNPMVRGTVRAVIWLTALVVAAGLLARC